MYKFTALRRKFHFLVMLSAIWNLPILGCLAGAPQSPPLVGGHCEYRDYIGIAEIVSVNKVSSATEGIHDEYEVKYIFRPREEIQEEFAQAKTKVFQMLDAGGANPTGSFIERHDLKPGKQVECTLKVIIRGTCTPMLFEFPWTVGERY
jgi:hypothetical protein